MPNPLDIIELLAPFIGGYIVYGVVTVLKRVASVVGRLDPMIQRIIVVLAAAVLSGIAKFAGVELPFEALAGGSAGLAMLFHSGDRSRSPK